MVDHRPDPDALLAQIQAEEPERSRGRLKIFLGAVAGVGKTYAMLEEAHVREREGMGVLIGVVETHGRMETEALLEGLEVLPRRQVEHKGILLSEFDLDAALKRRPDLILVDELAHTNASGSRHAKRWQDVEELLAAGIDVYTTVNVQHMESASDVVAQITHIQVRETVPDSVLEKSDIIELIDLPPEELLRRLREGRIYIPEQAGRATQNFFQTGNLIALRQLALRWAAEHVDQQMQIYRRARGVTEIWPVAERILVGIGPEPSSRRLVRATKRISDRLGGEWIAAYLETPATARLSEADRNRVWETLRLAEQLGGRTVTLSGASVSEELLSYARTHNVSKIVVGKPTHSRWWNLLFGSKTDEVVRGSGDIDVYVITGDPEDPSIRQEPPPATKSAGWPGYVGATIGVALSTALALLARPYFEPGILIMIYLLNVVLVAVRGGRGPSILASVLGVAAFDFFCVPPYLSFAASDTQYLITFGAMLIVALVISTLTTRLRRQVVMLRGSNQHARALQALGEKLGAAADEAEVASAGCEAVDLALGCQVVILRRSSGAGGLQPAGAQPSATVLGSNDLAAAEWVAANGQPAGRFTETLSASPWWFIPMLVEGRTLGVVGLRFAGGQKRVAPEQRHLVEAIVQQVALATDRTKLVGSLEAARVEGETESLRSALLSSVSHDLRSPLTSVIGAVTSLVAYGEAMTVEDRRELFGAIKSEGERLDRYIQNLLDMTQLGSGGLKLNRDWVELGELVGSAAGRLGRYFPAVEVRASLDPDLPPLYVHPALIEQALFNILENAARVSPPGAEVSIAAGRSGDRIVIDISDRGPGIPEQERRLIFDMFYTTQRGDREPHGRGLGLTIVRGMVGAHGGRVEAMPGRDGIGTTIRVTLPQPEPPIQPDPADEGA